MTTGSRESSSYVFPHSKKRQCIHRDSSCDSAGARSLTMFFFQYLTSFHFVVLLKSCDVVREMRLFRSFHRYQQDAFTKSGHPAGVPALILVFRSLRDRRPHTWCKTVFLFGMLAFCVDNNIMYCVNERPQNVTYVNLFFFMCWLRFAGTTPFSAIIQGVIPH